jgi:hypothetical protein
MHFALSSRISFAKSIRLFLLEVNPSVIVGNAVAAEAIVLVVIV